MTATEMIAALRRDRPQYPEGVGAAIAPFQTVTAAETADIRAHYHESRAGWYVLLKLD